MEEFQETYERDVATRGNGSQVFTERYDEEAIGRLKELILTFFRQGDRKYYSIHIDGEAVVPKNCDGRKFDRYLQFMGKHTREVEVRMYQGSSPNCNKYVFVVNKIQPSGLSGVSVEREVEKALEQERLQNELKQLRKELSKKKRKLKKLKQQAEDSESGIDKLNAIVKDGARIAGTIAGVMGGNRAGLAGAEQQQAEPVSQVEVELEEEAEPEDHSTKKKSSKSKKIYKDLLEAYGEEGLENAMGWIAVLSEHPELQQMIKEKLNNQNTAEDE